MSHASTLFTSFSQVSHKHFLNKLLVPKSLSPGWLLKDPLTTGLGPENWAPLRKWGTTVYLIFNFRLGLPIVCSAGGEFVLGEWE